MNLFNNKEAVDISDDEKDVIITALKSISNGNSTKLLMEVLSEKYRQEILKLTEEFDVQIKEIEEKKKQAIESKLYKFNEEKELISEQKKKEEMMIEELFNKLKN